MQIEELLPQLFRDHINLDKWDRPADLVWMIGHLSAPPCPLPVNEELIRQELGRDDDGAHYDIKVLSRLKSQGVLKGWPGRGKQSGVWILNPNIEQWRGVPWLPSRRRVLEIFLPLLARNTVQLPGTSYGDTVQTGGKSPDREASKSSSSKGKSHPTSARHYPTTARTKREPFRRLTDKRTEWQRPSPINSLSEFSPSLSPSDQNREGESEWASTSPNQEAGNQLLQVVRDTIQSPVSGSMADRIRGVGRSSPDELPGLVTFARTLGGIKTAIEACRQLEEEAVRLDRAAAGRLVAFQRQQTIDRCPRCDHKGLILLPDDTVRRCDHTPLDDLEGVRFGL